MPDSQPDNLVLSGEGPMDSNGALPKARIDVEWNEQVYYGKPCYVLKDPTTLRYYRLRPPEYTIYQMLDGKNDLDAILQELKDRYPQEEYDAQSVMSFLVMLRGASLLHIPGETDTEYLLKRKEVLTRSLWQRIRTEYLFFKVPLFDPDKGLNWLHRNFGGIIYSRFMGICVMAMLAGALFLFFNNIDKVSEAQPILSWINLLYLGPSLLLIKWIHEYGHGLTSKHFGTEVHEMGILFLVFTPNFYCDVSDAWMIPEKRKRMWITAGGIVVEVVMAGIACYIWAFTEPKTFINQFSLNIMLAASLNTVLFNGNPLLRYDGYYFLMDWLEIPNLRQKGSGYLWYLFQRYVLGVDDATKPIDVEGRERTLIIYAISAAIYRWLVMIAIITLVWTFLDPIGLGLIGAVMAVGAIYTSLIKPIIFFLKFVITQNHRLHIQFVTAAILLVLIGSAAFIVLGYPVERSVDTQCIIRPVQSSVMYVNHPGFIMKKNNPKFVEDGQLVDKDQVLLVLTDPELKAQVDDLSFQIEQKVIELESSLRTGNQAKARQIQHNIDSLKAQYQQAKVNYDKLIIRAPRDGVLQLRTKKPLEKMVGQFLPIQSELFSVYNPDEFLAVAAVHHRDNGLIQEGQVAKVKLWAYDGDEIISLVKQKAARPVLRMSSPAFSTAYGGEVQTMPAATPQEAIEPAENTYELELPLENPGFPLREGMVGKAKIIMGDDSLFEIFTYWFMQTIRQDFRL